jgi:hypothetical protein
MIARLRAVLAPFLLTRGALLLVGLLASRLLISGLTLQRGNLVYHAPGPAPLEIWARWDSEWYLLIAEHGYHSEAWFRDLPVGYDAADATGFFPAYPLLIRALGSSGVPTLPAAVLLANGALLLALAFLWDLVRRDFGEDAARGACWAILVFPTSFFLSAVYAESLLLLGVVGALRAARADRPWSAGLWGALAALARPTGILVVLPLCDDLLLRAPAPARFRVSRLGALALPPAALGSYMLYCRAAFGSFAPFLARQERWRGPLFLPWRAFERYLESPHVHDAHHSSIDLAVAVLLVASIPFLFLRLRRSWAVWAAAAILLPLGSTLWSFSRFAATVFPFHVLAGGVWARSRAALAGYLAVVLPLSGLFMALYAAWWWVG